VRFFKAHAYGNDFLYVEKHAFRGTSPDTLTRQLCDRHQGIGADGLILYERTQDGASMRLFNADGSRAEVSGNGVRALGALLLRDDDRVQTSLTIHTDAGPKRLERLSRDGSRQTFRTAMGLPRDLRQVAIAVDGKPLELVVMDFGNPQAVVLGPQPANDTFERLGSALAHHHMFPQGTNVEFAEVDGAGAVRILIWERGVGPTASSGTGSCAALVAAAAFGGARREADVIAPGGTQRVEWREDNVFLTGWAEVLFEGDWSPGRQIPRT
jgi:diaminopimelate epimerase